MMEPEIANMEQTALSWPERATSLIVIDQKSYDQAAETLKEIARMEKLIKDHHEPIKRAAKEAHNQAIAAEKRFLDPLAKAKEIIRSAVTKWATERERLRLEAEKKSMEQQAANEEANRIKAAVEAEEKGAPAEFVNSILDTPTKLSSISVGDNYRKADGISLRKTWRAEVTDIKALCRAVAEGSVSTEAVLGCAPWLNEQARTFKDRLAIPGVVAISESNVAVRG